MNTLVKLPAMAAKTIRFDDSMLHVELQNGIRLSASLSRFPRLLHGSAEQRAEWRRVGAGDGVHWPLLDEDISIPALLRSGDPSQTDPKQMKKVIELIGEMYANSRQLFEITDGRRFTLDGVFVSTTGQVVAEYIYGLNSSPGQRSYDATTGSGKTVQIMLIGESGRGFSVRWTEGNRAAHAELMLCLQVGKQGFEEIYNGEFPRDLLNDRPVRSNGQANLPRALLQDLNPALLPKEHSFASINGLFQRKLAHAA